MAGIGVQELLIIGVIALIIFGPRQLPKMGRAIGETMRELKNVGKELNSLHEDDDAPREDSSRRRER